MTLQDDHSAGPANADGHDASVRRDAPHASAARANGGEAARRDRIQFVQVMRGVAAISVAFYHTHLILSLPQYGQIDTLGMLATKGWLGVNFFFVLSGFIILYAHAQDIGKPARLPRYLWRRFSRLYPAYWIFLTLYVVAAMHGVGYVNFKTDAGDLASSYALFNFVPSPTLPLKVAWTLFYEMRFYAVFALLLISPWAGFALLALWAAATLVRSFCFPALHWDVLEMWNIYFPVGMIACWSLSRIPSRYGPWLLALGVGLLIPLILQVKARIAVYMYDETFLFLFAAPFALVLAGGVLSEQHLKWNMPRWSVLLGEASYSIYLVHSAVISFVAQINHRIAFGRLPPLAVYGVAFAAAIAGGVVAHLFIERPVLLRLRTFEPRLGKPLGVRRTSTERQRRE